MIHDRVIRYWLTMFQDSKNSGTLYRAFQFEVQVTADVAAALVRAGAGLPTDSRQLEEILAIEDYARLPAAPSKYDTLQIRSLPRKTAANSRLH